MADASLAGVMFRAPLMLLGDGLGATIDDFVYHREVAVAEKAFDIKAGRVEAGTVSALRFGYTAVAPVCAAAPGIRTFLDLPIITGRGVLASR